MLGKELVVDAIEFIEVSRIFEPHGGLYDVLERTSGQLKGVSNILQRLARMNFYPSFDYATAFVSGYLAGHKHEPTGLGRD